MSRSSAYNKICKFEERRARFEIVIRKRIQISAPARARGKMLRSRRVSNARSEARARACALARQRAPRLAGATYGESRARSRSAAATLARTSTRAAPPLRAAVRARATVFRYRSGERNSRIVSRPLSVRGLSRPSAVVVRAAPRRAEPSRAEPVSFSSRGRRGEAKLPSAGTVPGTRRRENAAAQLRVRP